VSGGAAKSIGRQVQFRTRIVVRISAAGHALDISGKIHYTLGLTSGVGGRAFVNNLFDQHPQLNLNHQDQFTQLFEAATLRPRTFGVAISGRY
jgi:uncharacterized membrane protein YeiH